MFKLISTPLHRQLEAECGGWAGLTASLRQLGCDGIETIWSGEDFPEDLPAGVVVGYHLTFFPDWLDFYREDRPALLRKFGSLAAVWDFYGGWGAEHLLSLYRADLDRARALGASYVVFHVSDVSIEEGYTYRWLHTSREVIDAAAEVVNELLGDSRPGVELLLVNLWWPGLTMADPALTARLLEQVRCPGTGLMLDTGHLMNTAPDLRTQAEGVSYIHRVLDAHGSLCRYIRGLHLHQSLSGPYVRSHTGSLPPLPADYVERFCENYRHIQQIDQHLPWTDPAVATVLERLQPAYLTHELSASDWAQRCRRTARQADTLHAAR